MVSVAKSKAKVARRIIGKENSLLRTPQSLSKKSKKTYGKKILRREF